MVTHALRVIVGHEGPLPSIRRTSTANTNGPDAGRKLSARGGCWMTVTTCAARSVSNASSPHPVTTTSCMLNTARTVSGAPSAYRNCAHGSTYVRFSSTTRKPYVRRSRSTAHGFSLSPDAKTVSLCEALRRCLALMPRCVRDGLLLDGRSRMPMAFLLESHRLARRLQHRPDPPFEPS